MEKEVRSEHFSALVNSTVTTTHGFLPALNPSLFPYPFCSWVPFYIPSFIDVANLLGDPQTSRVCEGIVQEEQEMAQWLHRNLPEVTNISLQQAAH